MFWFRFPRFQKLLTKARRTLSPKEASSFTKSVLGTQELGDRFVLHARSIYLPAAAVGVTLDMPLA